MRVDDGRQWKDLKGQIPESDIDLAALYNLESRLPESYRVKPIASSVVNLATENPENDQSTLSNIAVGKTEGPFEEYGPTGGYYYYYHPIQFSDDCMACHGLQESDKLVANTQQLDASVLRPFRAVRVQVPYETTRLLSIWAYSSMIAVAVATLFIALFLEHRILKRLVIRPLKYLRDVTDQVADGSTDIRWNISTKDEFQALSDSLNHMLRHLIDAQGSMEQANRKLDEQVDKMAQVNLELFEANRLKSEFLANMSHELRTPLNSILGFSDVLQGIESLTDKQKKYAANIQRSGRTLLDMINDILDLAKIEAGKMQLQCTEFDIVNVVREQCESIRSLSDEKNIDVRVNITPEGEQIDQTVFQDKVKMQQILNNLLSNAIKFTPEGGFVTIDLDLSSDDHIVIAVVDTGVGIGESDQETIFEKFRQIPNNQMGDSLTREATGTGLGLSITKELCKLLDGEISVESEIGKGSTFVIELARRLPMSVTH
jgi:signal transduction histidine kinase